MKCPYCAEEILEEAKKCRFCGEWLDGRGVRLRETQIKNANSKRADQNMESCAGCAAVFIVGFFILLIWDFLRFQPS